MSSAKKWVITFVSLTVAVLVFIMAVNYFVDPYGYFRFQGGKYFELNDDYYTRVLKAERIKHFSDEYDAYIIGGSKASGIRSDNLSKIDGLHYYNSYIQSGNFEEYEKYINYIFENDSDVKKILLHISSIEVKNYSRQSMGDTYVTPAQVNRKSKIAEVLKMLMKNLKVSVEELGKIRDKKTNPVPYPELPSGERNLGKYYDAVKIDAEWFKQRYVMTDFKKNLKMLFKEHEDKAYDMEQCLATLKRIKAACEKRGVELEVIFGPSFISEIATYDGAQFRNYYGEFINIVGDAWDFSDYNDIMLNPYNFYNYLHFFYDIGDLMIDTIRENKPIYVNENDSMFGHFGYHVYADSTACREDDSELAITVTEYLDMREKQYTVLRDEYMKTGTIKLKSYDDKSNIVINSRYFNDSSIKARPGREEHTMELYNNTKHKYNL